MPKDHKTRQKEYWKRNHERLKAEDRIRKEVKRSNMKKDPELWKKHQEKDAARKRDARAKAKGQKKDYAVQTESQANNKPTSPPSPPSYAHKPSLIRSVKRAENALPRSPRKKSLVLKQLVYGLSPAKKSYVLGKQLADKRARKLTPACKDLAEKFLERSDISYTCPGKKDNVYCGKDENGEKVYKEKHYLLWTFKEILPLLNEELERELGESASLGYGSFQTLMTSLKHIKHFGQIPHFSCLCPKCENLELLIKAINSKATFLPTSSKTELLKLVVCNPENVDCIDGRCKSCPGLAALAGSLNDLCEVEDFSYYQWKKDGKKYPEKMRVSGSGEKGNGAFLKQLIEYKRHYYNKRRQHAEMSYLRQHLRQDEVLIQVDFSENYENRQQSEIQSAYFGHQAFSIYTACIWYHDTPDKVTSRSYAMTSNTTNHNKFHAFEYNKQLIVIAQQLVPGLKKVNFFSDGCAAQFKSRYCFSLLTKFNDTLDITWSYFESHHGKGAVDAIGGTVKSSVHRDVRANKVVIESAEQFANYADSTLGVSVSFTPAENIAEFDINLVVRLPGTQSVHFIERKTRGDGVSELHFYKNSQFQAPGVEPRIGIALYDSSGHSATYIPDAQDDNDTPSTSAAINGDEDLESDAESDRSDTGRDSENGDETDTAMDDKDSDGDSDKDDDGNHTRQHENEKICRPSCGDFVAVMLVGKKQRKLYVAQVTDTTPLPDEFEDSAQLKYMEAVIEGGSIYRWVGDDYSREPISNIIAVLDPPTVQGSATRETFTFNMKAAHNAFMKVNSSKHN